MVIGYIYACLNPVLRPSFGFPHRNLWEKNFGLEVVLEQMYPERQKGSEKKITGPVPL
jgi:hypothetical protein